MSTPLDFAYYGGLLLASPFLAWKVGRRAGRRHLAGLRERLGACPPRRGRAPCLWVHGVSVGEIRAVRPLIPALAREFPGWEIVLSTTTGTGQEVARRSYPERRVLYYPLDLSWSVRRVLSAIRPDLVLLVELEVWPNFLQAARQRRIPVAVVNGRISERSFPRYRLISRLYDPTGGIGCICVQTELYAERFRRLGVAPARIHVTGSIKYDELSCDPADGAQVRRDFGLGAAEEVLIGGSTHPGEERALLLAFARLRQRRPDLRLVLVPRHTERTAELRRLAAELAPGVALRTEQRAAAGRPLGPGEVLLVDTVGELGRLYSAADAVFVGGSLIPHGGQNILEPVAYGKPTLFGPHCQNFSEPAERLLAARGAVQLKGEPELLPALEGLLADPAAAAAMGRRGREAVLAARGASERTVQALRAFLAARQARRRPGVGP